MSISGLHNNWEHGSYREDRNYFLKKRENPDLMTDQAGGSEYVHIAGGNSTSANPTIGYGFDFTENSFDSVRMGILHALGLNADMSIEQVRRSGRADLADALEEIRKWKYQEKIRGKLVISTQTLINDLGAGGGRLAQAIKMTDQKATRLLDAILDGGPWPHSREDLLSRRIGINLPQSRERVALVSLFFNGGNAVVGPGLVAALKIADPLKSRSESWCQIRFVHDNKLTLRRNKESDTFGFVPTGADALITAKCLSHVFNGKFSGGDLSSKRIYDSIYGRAGATRVTEGLSQYLQTVQNKYTQGATLAAVLVDDDGHSGVVKMENSRKFGSGSILIMAEDGNDEISYYVGRNNYIDGGDGIDVVSYKTAKNISIDTSGLLGSNPHLIVKHDKVQDNLTNVEKIVTTNKAEVFHLRGLNTDQPGKVGFDTAGGTDVIWCGDGRYTVNGGDQNDLYIIESNATNTEIEFEFSGNFGRDVIRSGLGLYDLQCINNVKFADLNRGDVNVIAYGEELYGSGDVGYGAVVIDAGSNSVATSFGENINNIIFADGSSFTLSEIAESADIKHILHWSLSNGVNEAEVARIDRDMQKYYNASHLVDSVKTKTGGHAFAAMSADSSSISALNPAGQNWIAAT
ncbi:MAG TPA: hypothetical protein VK196_09335 [Magnetospirillum sp.]|nr:hypothetical protein [Magnetospirillum sp.]